MQEKQETYDTLFSSANLTRIYFIISLYISYIIKVLTLCSWFRTCVAIVKLSIQTRNILSIFKFDSAATLPNYTTHKYWTCHVNIQIALVYVSHTQKTNKTTVIEYAHTENGFSLTSINTTPSEPQAAAAVAGLLYFRNAVEWKRVPATTRLWSCARFSALINSFVSSDRVFGLIGNIHTMLAYHTLFSYSVTNQC